MNNQIKSDMHEKSFKSNAMTIYMYKSNRKNSISSKAINVNHLISKEIKLHDERILDQFVGTIETIVYNAKQFNNNLELSAYMSIFKKASYNNTNEDLYCTTQDIAYNWQRVKFSSIEQCINFIFSLYAIIYPYNELCIDDIYNNSSIKYFISMYCKHN